MYLINVEDQTKLKPLADDLEAIDDLDHVDLADLSSLSIMEVTDNAAEDWIARQPVVFSEEKGIVIAGFSIAGVNWLRDFGERIAEFGADPIAVAEFASRCKDGQVYFLDTF